MPMISLWSAVIFCDSMGSMAYSLSLAYFPTACRGLVRAMECLSFLETVKKPISFWVITDPALMSCFGASTLTGMYSR